MASTQKINILATGVTGYIGGTVLSRLLAHPDASTFNITALVRSHEKAEKLKTLGVTPVIGSHNDAEKMRKLAAEADVVFAMADCDDEVAAKSTLLGLKDRFEATSKRPIFINTSGTGTLTDDAQGMYTYPTIYDDSDPDQIETLPSTQRHRPVDLMIVEADKQGYASTYIILPSTIYGIADSPLTSHGISNPHSQQIPRLIHAGIQRGQAGMVGQGKNTWNHVHIDDIGELYILLFDAVRKAESATEVGHGREGYFFGENGEYLWFTLARTIALSLSARGIGNDEPEPFNEEETKKYRGMGTTSRARGTRSRALGWKPVHSTQDMLASVESEVEAIISRMK